MPPSPPPLPSPEPSLDIQHQPLRSINVNEDATFQIQVDPLLISKIGRATLFYQTKATDGTQKKTFKLISKKQGLYQATIPGKWITGKRIMYYVTLYGTTGQKVTQYRDHINPQQTQIKETYKDLKGGAESLFEEEDVRLLDSSFEFSLALGTGIGYINDQVFLIRSEREERVSSPTPAPLHSRLDFDLMLSSQWAVSAFTRLQIVEFAGSGGFTLKWIPVRGSSLKWGLSLGGGYGFVRHAISIIFRDEQNQKQQGFDTSLQGPFFYQVGTSFKIPLDEGLDFTLGLDFMHLLNSDPNDRISPALHLDLNLGISFGF